ncbi:MAG: DNA integrity scanning protein DisA nucleotide-binding domain protein [Candidatus Sulfobium sp.]
MKIVIGAALQLAKETGGRKLFLFLNSAAECRRFLKSGIPEQDGIVLVLPADIKTGELGLKAAGLEVIRNWSGNQTRFSRIKYAFLQGVMQGIITADSKVVCVLGPAGKSHIDTVTIHDLSMSWSEEFPFDVRSLILHKAFHTVMAVVDVALDIGALGREGKSVGTIFVIGDEENVLKSSHQVVFNPFKGYPRRERRIDRPEVVESLKELAKLDGAVVIAENGTVEAAGRHLDSVGAVSKKLRGLGSRHRAAAGITRRTESVSIVVSESTGKVTVFAKGLIVATLEPLISRRLV